MKVKELNKSSREALSEKKNAEQLISEVPQKFYISNILLAMFGKEACVQMLLNLMDDALNMAQVKLDQLEGEMERLELLCEVLPEDVDGVMTKDGNAYSCFLCHNFDNGEIHWYLNHKAITSFAVTPDTIYVNHGVGKKEFSRRKEEIMRDFTTRIYSSHGPIGTLDGYTYIWPIDYGQTPIIAKTVVISNIEDRLIRINKKTIMTGK